MLLKIQFTFFFWSTEVYFKIVELKKVGLKYLQKNFFEKHYLKKRVILYYQ